VGHSKKTRIEKDRKGGRNYSLWQKAQGRAFRSRKVGMMHILPNWGQCDHACVEEKESIKRFKAELRRREGGRYGKKSFWGR